MRQLIAVWRFLRVLLHTLCGWYLVRFCFGRRPRVWQQQTTQRWALGMLRILHVQLQTKEVPPDNFPALLAVNHVSWLDIVLLLASVPCCFIAKSEVQQWPLLGRMAQANETIFLQRQHRSGIRQIQKTIGDHLNTGAWVVLFAEGTTSRGETVLPFHSNLFQVPIYANVAVLPVALGYFDASGGKTSLAPAYVDNESMLFSLWRILRAPSLCAQVCFGPVLPSAKHTRKTLAAQAHVQVLALQQQQKRW